MVKSLYIHIPFCSSICSYCDFCKLIFNDKFVFSYLESLKKEIASYGNQKYKTIYIGGGTPSTLNVECLQDLLSFLYPMLENDCEFTIEVNPESIDENKLNICKKYGINRISIGLQTTNDDTLKLLNRCSFKVFLEKYKLIRKLGFTNVNVDLMYALPNEKDEQVIKDIEKIIELNPEHISTYSLILEENSIFGKKGIKEASEDIQAAQYELILSKLRENGYERYEVSNFSKPSYESKHNLTYWRNQEYVGCGLGASGYIGNKRYTNTKNLNKYLKGDFIETKENLSIKDKEEYFLITHLRLKEGFSLKKFKEEFGVDFKEKHQNAYKKAKNNLLITESNGRIIPTDKGILLLDRILVDLI